MIHGREDYECIQDNTLAKELARILLRMRVNFTSSEGLVAQLLAKMILYPDQDFEKQIEQLHLNNFPRIPINEPVFLFRAQDPLAVATIQDYLSKLKELNPSNSNTHISIEKQIDRFREWPICKICPSI